MAHRYGASPFRPLLRVVTGLLGAGAFGAGVLAVFVSENGIGTGVLLAFGGVLLVFALFGNLVESFELGGATLRLRAAAADMYAQADESARDGDTEAADRLRAEAAVLMDAAGPIAADYRRVRGSMGSGRERTRAMGDVVARARRAAEGRDFDPAEVARWLRTGSDEQRVTALAMMQADHRLRDADAVIAAVEEPRSPFEQYQALVLVRELAGALDPAQRQRLGEAIESQKLHWRLRGASDRLSIGAAVLRQLNRPQTRDRPDRPE